MSIKVSKDVWNLISSYLPKESWLPRYITYDAFRDVSVILHPNIYKKRSDFRMKITFDTKDINIMVGPVNISLPNGTASECIGIIKKNSKKSCLSSVDNPYWKFECSNFDIVIFKQLNETLYNVLMNHINTHDFDYTEFKSNVIDVSDSDD